MGVEETMTHLKCRGLNVLAGILSPSSNLYVRDSKHRSKLRANQRGIWVDANHRREMNRLAISDDRIRETSTHKLFVGEWESSNDATWTAKHRGSFPDYDDVIAYYIKRLHAEGMSKVKVFYVCGADHYNKVIQTSFRGTMEAKVGSRWNMGACAVLKREGSPKPTMSGDDQYIDAATADDFSSSKARDF